MKRTRVTTSPQFTVPIKDEGREICHKVPAPNPCVCVKEVQNPEGYVITLGSFSQEKQGRLRILCVWGGNNAMFMIWVLIKSVLKTMKTSMNMPSAAP
jgi:hypothetical protein